MTSSDEPLIEPSGRRTRWLWIGPLLIVLTALFVGGTFVLMKRQRANDEMVAARDYLATMRQNLLYLYGNEQSPAPGYLLNEKQTDASPKVRDMYLDLANCYSVAISDLDKMIAERDVLPNPQVISIRLEQFHTEGSSHRSLNVEWLEIERGKEEAFAGIYIVDPQGRRHDFPIPTDVSARLWDVPNAYRQHAIILAEDGADLSELGLSKFALVLKLSPGDRKLIESDAAKAGLLLKDGSATNSVAILRAE